MTNPARPAHLINGEWEDLRYEDSSRGSPEHVGQPEARDENSID